MIRKNYKSIGVIGFVFICILFTVLFGGNSVQRYNSDSGVLTCDDLKKEVERSIEVVSEKYSGKTLDLDDAGYANVQNEIGRHNGKIAEYYEICEDPDYAPIPIE